MWLALAHQAAGDDDACIATYKFVEDNHPLLKVRNQAANLRFICQAPKLKRGPDEMVQIPVLKIEDRKKCAPGPTRRVALQQQQPETCTKQEPHLRPATHAGATSAPRPFVALTSASLWLDGMLAAGDLCLRAMQHQNATQF